VRLLQKSNTLQMFDFHIVHGYIIGQNFFKESVGLEIWIKLLEDSFLLWYTYFGETNFLLFVLARWTNF